MKVDILKILGNKIQYVEEGVKEIKEAELTNVVKPEYVNMGSAEITIKDKKVTYCKMDNPTNQKPSGNSNSNTDRVTFGTLLTAAHKKAKDAKHILSITTGVIKGEGGKVVMNIEKQFIMFKARVTITDKEGKEVCKFDGTGDTLKENVTGTSALHWIRIAETRAIVRALKLYTDNATCSEEEK